MNSVIILARTTAMFGPLRVRRAALAAEPEWLQQQFFSEGGLPNVSS